MTLEHHFISDLVIALGAAAIGGFVTNRFRQPVLIGYLISGFVIGPHGLGLLQEVSQIKALAEIGVAFLLFALGVEFSLGELKRVKDIAIQGSLLQMGGTIALIAILSTLFGWANGWSQGIFLGALLSLSSTAVVLKTLTERGEVNTPHGQIMLAILIVQDLALGLMLAILPALNQSGAAMGITIFWAIVKVFCFLLGALAAGIWLVPPLIKAVANTESNELFLLTVIALCLGVALITEALGLSVEMGAFIAGLMIAEIDYADQALAKILPLRDTFASLFFASIGMLINPMILANNLMIILGLVILVMIGKALIILPIILRFGYSFKTALIVSLGLNQIGEFSFVLAQVGLEIGILSEKKYLLILGTTAITLVIAPVLVKWSSYFAEEMMTFPALKPYLQRFQTPKFISIPETLQNHVVIAGYGRVGQVLVNILQNQGYSLLVLENSEAAVQRLRSLRIPYILGDAESDLVLEKARLDKALALAIALPDPNSTRLLLRRALAISPELDVVVRAHTNREIEVLTQLGAWEVVQPEFEAALEIGAHLLETLGNHQSQIQSVIQNIRTDRYRSVSPDQQSHPFPELAESLNSQWLPLIPQSPLVGMTLAEADIRRLTGVTIMAIERDHQTLPYPTANTVLRQKDHLLAVGSQSELSILQDLISGHCDLILAGAGQWVTLPETSPLMGKTLTPTDLDQKYQGVIIALRRQGKLYTTLSKPWKFKSGDSLLLQQELHHVEALLSTPSKEELEN